MTEQRPTFINYNKINIPNEYINIVIGKKFRNINNIKSLSPEVRVSFISDRDNGNNYFIIKSNNTSEFNRVLRNIDNLINQSYNIYKEIKNQEKEKRKIQKKFKEIKIRKEISEKIEKEMLEKEMNEIKLACASNLTNNVKNNLADNLNINNRTLKSNNPFYGLEIEYDSD
jgi:hypothetical protein